MIIGTEGRTYARTGADLIILDDDTLRVLPTLGKGSLQIYPTFAASKASIFQADALTYHATSNSIVGLAAAVTR